MLHIRFVLKDLHVGTFNLALFTTCNRTDDSHEKKPKAEGGRPNTWTCKVGCPSVISVYRKVKQNGAAGDWYVQRIDTTHNHLITSDPRQIKCRTFDQDEKDNLAKHAEKGISFNLLRALFQDSTANTLSYMQVLNAVKSVKRKYQNGRSDVRTLQDQLKDNDELFCNVRISYT